MSSVFGTFDAIRDFLNTGGDVLWVILFVSIILWCLIAERFIYFRLSYPDVKQQWLAQWRQRADKHSAHSLNIRESLISQANIELGKTLPLIKMLVSLCPLLGLLGTVTGMIQVFDVMAVTGTGNARAMASGVSKATIPTMAGMVIAIAGLYFNKLIEEKVKLEIHHLADLLKYR
ncbi:MAG: MotA/TolQ/ExbB proton channel family protein [Methyloprofundus sp.]|nr:MotA/TolQ/ExbB proton channel family protein [Methyloprofundus sp.]